jgi:hypothetical protein
MDYLHNNRKDAIRGYDMYSYRGKVIVDRVFRYEEMERSLQELSTLVGIHVSLPEYRAKSQFRTDNKHYSDILRSQEADLIARRFAREIDLLGYTF